MELKSWDAVTAAGGRAATAAVFVDDVANAVAVIAMPDVQIALSAVSKVFDRKKEFCF